ncbi:hypothetical protein AOQ84DRAFT_383452, partial [Glonium stellatum]
LYTGLYTHAALLESFYTQLCQSFCTQLCQSFCTQLCQSLSARSSTEVPPKLRVELCRSSV